MILPSNYILLISVNQFVFVFCFISLSQLFETGGGIVVLWWWWYLYHVLSAVARKCVFLSQTVFAMYAWWFLDYFWGAGGEFPNSALVHFLFSFFLMTEIDF